MLCKVFFQMTRKGKKIYFLGTLHNLPKSIGKQIAKVVDEEVESNEYFSLFKEACSDSVDMFNVAKFLAFKIKLRNSLKLKELFPDDIVLLEKYINFLKKNDKLELDLDDSYKEYIVKLTSYLNYNSSYSFDDHILEEWECQSLDDIEKLQDISFKLLSELSEEEYSNLEENYTIEDFIHQTEKFLNSKDRESLTIDYLKYPQIDMDKILGTDAYKAFEKYKKQLIDKRNSEWVKIINKELSEEDVIVVICGKGHLSGKGNLIDYYGKRGWKKKLIPIEIKERIFEVRESLKRKKKFKY